MVNKARKILVIVFSWLTVLATMAIIARFSLQNGSESSSTSHLFVTLIPFYDKLSPDLLSIIHTVIRKLAHFTIYMLLGFTAFNAFCVSVKIKRIFLYVCAISTSIIYAVVDEFVFQALTPGRAPMFTDVCIDTLGALLGALIMLFIWFLIGHIKNKEISK